MVTASRGGYWTPCYFLKFNISDDREVENIFKMNENFSLKVDHRKNVAEV